MPGEKRHGSGEEPAQARGLAAFADAAWLRVLIGALAVLSMVTLVFTLGSEGERDPMALAHALSGAALFIVLVVWLMASRSALAAVREQRRAWQQSRRLMEELVNEQVLAQERIERLATVDSLTQLANRQTFDERAARLLAGAYSENKRCALLFIDLDNFRLLNNGYGHRVGDEMLAIVARRIRDVIAEPDLIGRRGGDELVALLVDIPGADRAVEVAQALIKSVSEPARVLGMEVAVTPSVGISFFPQDGVDLDSLLNAADAAMYQAKESGRRTYAFYTPTVARRVDLRLRLEQRLRKAVESRDFRLFYQPLVSLADGKMVGAEALIRWRDAELGEISPAEFVPIAEESGLIVGLGDWVIREACRHRQEWRALGVDVPPVSLNMA
ncbi:MAG: putative bifunctional diguanylate cyclase/phosphodiesterase, partial [Betaproteobacteria bacterium]